MEKAQKELIARKGNVMVLKWRKQKWDPQRRKLGAGFVHKIEPTQW